MTLYAARISRHLSLSRASYDFWRSKNTLKRTASLMSVRCCSSLALRATVPVPWPSQNLCSLSWTLMDDARRQFRRLVTAFQSNSTRTTPPKIMLAPLGIRTTVYHVLSLDISPSRNSACTMATTFCQLVASGLSSRVSSIKHWRRCSARIPNRPPERFRRSLRTAQEIY